MPLFGGGLRSATFVWRQPSFGDLRSAAFVRRPSFGGLRLAALDEKSDFLTQKSASDRLCLRSEFVYVFEPR
jgi:hypothetical protein